MYPQSFKLRPDGAHAPDGSLHEAVDAIVAHLHSIAQTQGSLANRVRNLAHTIDATRASYHQTLRERDETRAKLEEAQRRLADVQRVVQRYTGVQDPVVASDGYTYEKAVIRQYLDECAGAETDAYSQQTKEVLTPKLIPNQSLKKLVELLKMVRPSEVPPPTPFAIIPPLGGGSEGENDGAIHASDLEAAFAAKARIDDEKLMPMSMASTLSHFAVARPLPSPTPDTPAGDVRLHPCLRVYGHCNFRDDCQFARYPFEACLNNIKGKCRYGSQCKELHVNPDDPAFRNPRHQGGGRGGLDGRRGGRGAR